MAEPLDDQRGEELTAYLDGELEPRAAEALERQLRKDADLRREADTLKRTWELLDFLPQPEPSPNFASRTLDKLAVVVPPGALTRTKTATSLSLPSPGPWPRRLVLAVSAAAVFLAGYGLTGQFIGPKLLTQEQREQQMARDLRVLERLNLYQHADDAEFLKALDQPELFGD